MHFPGIIYSQNKQEMLPAANEILWVNLQGYLSGFTRYGFYFQLHLRENVLENRDEKVFSQLILCHHLASACKKISPLLLHE